MSTAPPPPPPAPFVFTPPTAPTTKGRKTKILIAGPPVSSHADGFATLQTLCKKVSTLNGGKAGPFDCVFVTGALFGKGDGDVKDVTLPSFPIPVYFYDYGIPPPEFSKKITEIADSITKNEAIDEDAPRATELAPNSNLHYIGSSGLSEIHGLVMCWTTNLRGPAPTNITTQTSHPQYLGCDLLLTSSYPQNSLSLFPPTITNILTTLTPDFSPSTFGDGDLADLAVKARPRYHLVGGAIHLLAVPYLNADPINQKKKYHATRLIGLADVSNCKIGPVLTSDKTAEKKLEGLDQKKSGKFLHAVGIFSLTTMNLVDLNAVPAGSVRCPYDDDSNIEKIGGGGSSTSYGLSEGKARALASSGDGGQYRWAGRGVDNNANRKRGRDDGNSGAYGPGGADDGSMPNGAVDPNCKTLFVSGLNRDPGGVVNVGTLSAAFAVYKPTRVNIPPGKAFAFVEFSSHEDANNTLANCSGGIDVLGVWLNINWGKANSNSSFSNDGGSNKRQRTTKVTVRRPSETRQ